eukprot:scaffold84976_cov60-Phaeocystis_antarctica.AAC.3
MAGCCATATEATTTPEWVWAGRGTRCCATVGRSDNIRGGGLSRKGTEAGREPGRGLNQSLRSEPWLGSCPNQGPRPSSTGRPTAAIGRPSVVPSVALSSTRSSSENVCRSRSSRSRSSVRSESVPLSVPSASLTILSSAGGWPAVLPAVLLAAGGSSPLLDLLDLVPVEGGPGGSEAGGEPDGARPPLSLDPVPYSARGWLGWLGSACRPRPIALRSSFSSKWRP